MGTENVVRVDEAGQCLDHPNCRELDELVMSTPRANSNSAGRALIAGVALWIFVLQGLSVLLAMDLKGYHFDESALSSIPAVSAELCSSPAGDKSSGHNGCGHSHYCIWCASSARDALPTPSLRSSSFEVPLFPESRSRDVDIADNRDREPAGWASSWSSRAPPSIS